MKILGLQIQGIGKIKAMEMKFRDKGIIPIIGKNNQGKTTILKCLEMLISGGNVPKDIINHDSAKGIIIATVDGYTIKKTITDQAVRLEVSTDTAIVKSPQGFLSSLINSVSFNPFSFINKTAQDKKKDMLQFAGINFDEINGKISEAEQNRLVIGRLIKDFGVIEPVEPVEEVNIIELQAEKEKIESENQKAEKAHYETLLAKQKEIFNHNNMVKEKKTHYESLQQRYESLQASIIAKEQELLSLKSQLKMCGDTVKETFEATKDLKEKNIDDYRVDPPQLVSVDSINAKILQAKAQNLLAVDYRFYLDKKRKLEKTNSEYKTITQEIETLRKQKIDTLKNAKLPVEGLEVREDGVYYYDTFSENLSTSESIKLACDLCLSKNPKLRAITIDRGECFDGENLKYIEEWGEKNDMQCFITIVDEIPDDQQDGVFYIEEGALV